MTVKYTRAENIRATHLLGKPCQHPAVKKVIRNMVERHGSALLLQVLLRSEYQLLKNGVLEIVPCAQHRRMARKFHLL
jgi:hypothetical protein